MKFSLAAMAHGASRKLALAGLLLAMGSVAASAAPITLQLTEGFLVGARAYIQYGSCPIGGGAMAAGTTCDFIGDSLSFQSGETGGERVVFNILGDPLSPINGTITGSFLITGTSDNFTNVFTGATENFTLSDGDIATVSIGGFTSTTLFDNNIVFSFSVAPPSTVPEPFTLSLFGAGLAGAVAMRRRKKSGML